MALPAKLTSRKKAKIDPQEIEVQPVEDVKEESSQNCSDSEDSSASQSASTVEAEDIESDLESLEEHYYSNLRQYSATLERDFPAHYTLGLYIPEPSDNGSSRAPLVSMIARTSTSQATVSLWQFCVVAYGLDGYNGHLLRTMVM